MAYRRTRLARLEEADQGYSLHVSFLVEQVQHHYPEELSLKTLSQRRRCIRIIWGAFSAGGRSKLLGLFEPVPHRESYALLLHTDQKTADIAFSVGYTDSSYFYRQFKSIRACLQLK